MAIAMRYGTAGDIAKGGGSGGGGMTADALWTNSAPTSSFGSQSVPLSAGASNYKFLGVYYLFSTSNPVRTTSLVPVADLQNGAEGMCIVVAWGVNRTGVRRFSLASDTSVSFTTCGYNGGTDNTYAVPVAIYGIK